MSEFSAPVVDPLQLPLFLSVEETARIIGISRSTTFDAIHAGQIPHVRFGRRVRVPRNALLALGMDQAEAIAAASDHDG